MVEKAFEETYVELVKVWENEIKPALGSVDPENLTLDGYVTAHFVIGWVDEVQKKEVVELYVAVKEDMAPHIRAMVDEMYRGCAALKSSLEGGMKEFEESWTELWVELDRRTRELDAVQDEFERVVNELSLTKKDLEWLRGQYEIEKSAAGQERARRGELHDRLAAAENENKKTATELALIRKELEEKDWRAKDAETRFEEQKKLTDHAYGELAEVTAKVSKIQESFKAKIKKVRKTIFEKYERDKTATLAGYEKDKAAILTDAKKRYEKIEGRINETVEKLRQLESREGEVARERAQLEQIKVDYEEKIAALGSELTGEKVQKALAERETAQLYNERENLSREIRGLAATKEQLAKTQATEHERRASAERRAAELERKVEFWFGEVRELKGELKTSEAKRDIAEGGAAARIKIYKKLDVLQRAHLHSIEWLKEDVLERASDSIFRYRPHDERLIGIAEKIVKNKDSALFSRFLGSLPKVYYRLREEDASTEDWIAQVGRAIDIVGAEEAVSFFTSGPMIAQSVLEKVKSTPDDELKKRKLW